MKKKITLFLSVCMLLGTVACSSASGKTGPAIDQTISSAQEKSSEKTTTGQTNLPKETKPTTTEAAATQPIKSSVATIEEQVLIDDKDIVITALSLEMDGWMGPELKVLIENNSKTDVTIQTRGASVNGYMNDPMMSADVAAGKKSNDTITFSKSDLNKAGITSIADIELFFHIFKTAGWDKYLDTDLVQIKTSFADEWNYTFDDSGELLYEKKDIRIIAKGISESDSFMGPGLVLFIENMGKKAITVQARDTSVNGFMVDGSLSSDVYPGKRAITTLTFFSSDLEKNNIEAIEDLELAFHIFDTDKWDTIDDTKKYVLTFN